jgi:hypothetical protein
VLAARHPDPHHAASTPAVHLAVANAAKAWQTHPAQTPADHAMLIHWLDALSATLTGHGAPAPVLLGNHALVQALHCDPARYADAALSWLAQHHEQEQAQFLLNAWLKHHRHPAIAANGQYWLRRHGHKPVASFVLKAWLDAGGEFSQVEEAALAWLAQHGTAAEARFVLKAWLDAGGEFSQVEEAMLAWLAQHSTAAEAQFVLKAWLDAGGEFSQVEKAALAWLAQHGTAAEACFVLKAWLDAGGELAVVDAYIQRWFAHPGHALGEGATFLLRAYGDHSRYLPSWLQPYACTWLECHWQQPDAGYALKHIVKIRPLPASTVEACVAWCVRHAQDPDAVARLSALPTGALAVVSDRPALLAEAATVLLAQLPSLRKEALRLSHALTCLAKLSRLRGVAAEAWVQLAQAACQVVRLLADGQLAKRLAALHMPDKVARLLASTNWATLLPLGAPAHVDPLLHQGEQALLQCCDTWAAAPAR